MATSKIGDDLVFHVHTEKDQDIDPIHGELIDPYTVWGYAQKSSPKELKRIVAI